VCALLQKHLNPHAQTQILDKRMTGS